jgi:hypothetical protein
LAINFKPIKENALKKAHESGEGCLINGLWLEAARWQDLEESQVEKEPITL